MPHNKTNVANTPAIITAAGTVLAANQNRRAWAIQNLGTNPLFVRLDASASTSVFHFILKGATGADDGTGGYFSDDIHTDAVSVAGTSPRCVVTEL